MFSMRSTRAQFMPGPYFLLTCKLRTEERDLPEVIQMANCLAGI